MKRERFTLPGEAGMEKEIINILDVWGVDAIRDSDGTELSQELVDLGLEVYSTVCLVRMDNEFAKAHPEYRQQIYLGTPRETAFSSEHAIDIMASFFADQFAPNTDVELPRYWQVVDRTTGEPFTNWRYENGKVLLSGCTPYHEYSVTFLAYQLWEPVSMYNHLVNDWTEEHKIPVDVRYPEVQAHVLRILEDWLKTHPKTDIVRFTTFFYNFDLIYNQFGKEKQVNWFGYNSCVSPLALSQFEEIYGYALTPEDFIDNGCYNTPFVNPTKRYMDWIEFNQKFVCDYAAQCVALVHKYNKKAIMFLGDHWAGTEPYGEHFSKIGLDAVVGAAGDGVTTRMIADIPGVDTEARMYPYFFPDTFYPGGDPVGASTPIWIRCRRAMLRSPMQRMGYGGYLSLAFQFPDFVDHVTMISRQFKEISDFGKGTRPDNAPFKVAVLNSWGSLRSWQTHQVAHSLWNQRCYSYLGVLEVLAGSPFDVQFLSFDELRENGVPEDVGVVLNLGDADTSWSGGQCWTDPKILEHLRAFVHRGGGFVGAGEPTAHAERGHFFALSDVLGVQKEQGFTASNNKMFTKVTSDHFLSEGLSETMDWGEGMPMVYALSEKTAILALDRSSIALSAHTYGKGRAVYLGGLPYNNENARLLMRVLFWSASRESELSHFVTDNPAVECHHFSKAGVYCLVNNSSEPQSVTVSQNGNQTALTLESLELKWLPLENA